MSADILYLIAGFKRYRGAVIHPPVTVAFRISGLLPFSGVHFERLRLITVVLSFLSLTCTSFCFGQQLVCEPVKYRLEKIDAKNLLSLPIGSMIDLPPGVRMPSAKKQRMTSFPVPEEWSKGAKCGALRITSVFIDCDTWLIRGGMSSFVYPTIQEGAFAITNQIYNAVLKIAGDDLREESWKIGNDGTRTSTLWWKSVSGKVFELVVQCVVNGQTGQMAVACCLHTKGDGLRISPPKEMLGSDKSVAK